MTFQRLLEDDSIEKWKNGSMNYYVRNLENEKVSLWWDGKDEYGREGGGATRFDSRSQLDEYVERFKLRPVKYEQTTLF